MQALLTESEARGYRLMVAVIGNSANLASIGVHTRTGFQMVGTLQNVGLKFGRWLDTVLMQRPLGEGAGTIPGEVASEVTSIVTRESSRIREASLCACTEFPSSIRLIAALALRE